MAYQMVLRSPKGPARMRKAYRGIRDEALREAGTFWAENILPEHFKAGAESKYRYAARTEQHMRRKRREGKGADPNVYTGRLRDKMVGMAPSMTVTAKGLVLRWPGLPRYTYVVDTMEWTSADKRWNDELLTRLPAKAQEGIMRWRRDNPKSAGGRFKLVKRPDKVAEITRVTRADANQVGRTFRKVFLAGIKALKTKGKGK